MVELLDLPTEILLHIIRLLCPHCIIESQNLGICACHYEGSQPTEPPKQLNPSELLRQDLARLSRTCRTLRDLGQPILYHSPVPRQGYWASLANTLVKRHDLALCVRELHLGDGNQGTVPRSWCTDQALFDALLARFPTDNTGRERAPLPDGWLMYWVKDGGVRRGHPGAIIDALCLTLTPNVEHVHVSTCYLCPGFPYCMPGSLPRLTDLTLECAGVEGVGESIDCVKGILIGAPALVRFKGIRINGMPADVTHPTLRSVDLVRSALTGRHLENVMRGFPRLEAFGYDNDSDVTPESAAGDEPDQHQAMPREIGEALLLRRDTLRDVDVDFARARLYDFVRLSRVDAMGGFGEMEALEVLALDRDAIYISKEMRPDYEWSDDGEDYPGMSEEEDEAVLKTRRKKDFLVEFLPPSIRYFKFFDRNGLLFPDLMRVAEMAPERFPRLEKVRLWGIGEEERLALKGAFKAVGVKVYYGGNL